MARRPAASGPRCRSPAHSDPAGHRACRPAAIGARRRRTARLRQDGARSIEKSKPAQHRVGRQRMPLLQQQGLIRRVPASRARAWANVRSAPGRSPWRATARAAAHRRTAATVLPRSAASRRRPACCCRRAPRLPGAYACSVASLGRAGRRPRTVRALLGTTVKSAQGDDMVKKVQKPAAPKIDRPRACWTPAGVVGQANGAADLAGWQAPLLGAGRPAEGLEARSRKAPTRSARPSPPPKRRSARSPIA